MFNKQVESSKASHIVCISFFTPLDLWPKQPFFAVRPAVPHWTRFFAAFCSSRPAGSLAMITLPGKPQSSDTFCREISWWLTHFYETTLTGVILNHLCHKNQEELLLYCPAILLAFLMKTLPETQRVLGNGIPANWQLTKGTSCLFDSHFYFSCQKGNHNIYRVCNLNHFSD